MFISMGEYIKLAEREKEAHTERSAHWEAETDLRALRKLRNQRRVDNLYTRTIVGKVSALAVYYSDRGGTSLWSIYGRNMDSGWATGNDRDIRDFTIYK